MIIKNKELNPTQSYKKGMSSMLIVDHLTVQYNDSTIPFRDLSFALKEGETGCILGLSGIGKSTLLKAIGGILKPSFGTISLNHCPLTPAQHLIGYMSQDYGLYPWKTVKENIILLNKVHKRSFTAEVFNEVIETLNLQDLLSAYPNILSGGQKQRVALARVFLFEPDLLLLDEPFSSLDEITRSTAQNLFLMLWKKNKPTTLLVTHSIDEAIKLGHYIFVLNDEKIESIFNPNFSSQDPEKVKSLKTDIVNYLNL